MSRFVEPQEGVVECWTRTEDGLPDEDIQVLGLWQGVPAYISLAMVLTVEDGRWFSALGRQVSAPAWWTDLPEGWR